MPLLPRLLAGILRLFFYLIYGPMAWSYDLVAWTVSLGRWQRWVRSVLPAVAGPRVLELGHGPGHLQAALNEKGVTAFGLDQSPQMGRLAKRRLRKSGAAARLVRGEAGRLPFAGGSFDQVAATFPTEFIAEDGPLSETRRVLRSGGRLVIVPVAWITGDWVSERLASWLFRATGQAGEWTGELSQAIERVGFAVEEERVELEGSAVMVVRGVKSGLREGKA